MTEKVIDANEIALNGVRYPVLRGIRRFVLNQLVPQITTGAGDPTQEDVVSKWHIHNTAGGFGRYRFSLAQGDTPDKFWDSQCNTDSSELSLPALATELVDLGAAPVKIVPQFGSADYFLAGTVIRRFDGTNVQFYCTVHNAWETAPVTGGHTAKAAPATVVDAVVYDGYLHILCTSDYLSYDGATTWLSNGSGRAAAYTATYGIVWDEKLMVVDATGQIKYSQNPENATPTWTNLAIIYDDTPTGMTVYEDTMGDPAVHVGTARGPYIVDFANGKALKLQVRFSDAHADNCRGISAWNGDLVFGKGGNVRRYGTGAQAQITDLGPNKDDGLPTRLLGRVVGIETTMEHFMLAALDAGAQTSSIMKWTGSAWQPFVEADVANESIRCLAFSTLTTTPRLYWGQGNSIWWATMYDITSNPVQAPSFPRRTAADHITPWFGIPSMRSLGIDLRFRSKGIATGSETVTIYFGLNDDDSQWTLLGTVPRNGNSIVRFSVLGQKFYSIRFKFSFARGATTTNTPRLSALTFRWAPVPEPLYGYACEVDLSQAYKGRQPSELEDALETALGEPMVLFSYRPNDDRSVKVQQSPSVTFGGHDSRGHASLTMSELVAASTTVYSYFKWDGTSPWDGSKQWL